MRHGPLQGFERLGLVAVRARFDEREQLTIELYVHIVDELAHRWVSSVAGLATAREGGPHARDHAQKSVRLCHRKRLEGFAKKLDGIEETVPLGRANDGRTGRGAAPLLERQEAAGEIAAVHRRDVSG